MLSVQIFSDSSLTSMLADYTSRIHPPDGGGMRFSTNGHGFAALELPLVPMTLVEAFEVYDWPGIPHAIVSDSAAGVVWEGRVEDIGIVPGGVGITAMGYQRALWDMPYIAMWSKTGSGDWRPVLVDNYSSAQTQQYETDNNNRIYIAPRKGESIRSGNNDWGMMTFAAPHGGARNITNISFDYSINLTANWRFYIVTFDDDFANAYIDYSLDATGSTQTGTVTEALTTPNARVAVAILNNTGSTETIAGDTGDRYARLTNIRMKTTTTATVLASEIVASIVSGVNTVNPTQLENVTALIEATTTDLRDELYEDESLVSVLDRLALLHGYEWGVYEGRVLHFRERASAGRSWYVDVTKIIELQRTVENLANSVYATYRDASGRTRRTDDVGDADSQERYGLARRSFVNVQTTSQTEAETHRSLMLVDRANRQARARIEFDQLYDAAGAIYPLYAVRAGDTVTMRNLSPSLSTTVDEIRVFTVGETEYDAAADRLQLSPEEPIPSLVTLVARRGAGL